jgi:hypothetical protein
MNCGIRQIGNAAMRQSGKSEMRQCGNPANRKCGNAAIRQIGTKPRNIRRQKIRYQSAKAEKKPWRVTEWKR